MATLFLTACSTISPPPEKISLNSVAYAELPGWDGDRVAEAIPALARSCTKKNLAKDWATPCAIIKALPPKNEALARQAIERWFTPYAVEGEGLFTGYYEAELLGAKHRHGKFQTPLYARPRDLVAVDLGLFKDDLKGKRIVGKVEKGKLIPYDPRASIDSGSLKKRAKVLLWVDDPVDAFFLAIQGSGRVRVEDGTFVRIGYDGANGRDYVAIGRVLADGGELQKPVTMQSIRAWLAAHPDESKQVMDKNPSYVFFRILKGDGPVGAEGVSLTPMRSLAVDPHFMKLGTPVWLDTTDGAGAPMQRLMVAQDTGGAIKGPVRGDVFWGHGAAAEAGAGPMQSRGHYYVLLPSGMPPDGQ